MKPRSYIIAGLLAAAVSSPALASTHTIKITNPDGDRISRFSVMHAKVIGFKPTNAKEFEVTVELPEGSYCNPIVRVTLGNSGRVEGRIAICQNQGFSLVDK